MSQQPALGLLPPELTGPATAFATPLIYSLNPAHPDVRAYIVALCGDLAESYEIDALALETPGWLPGPTAIVAEFCSCCRSTET